MHVNKQLVNEVSLKCPNEIKRKEKVCSLVTMGY